MSIYSPCDRSQSRRGNTHRLALSDDDVSLMAGLTQLRSLCIERFSIECDGDPRLDQLSALTALTALSVHHAMLYSYGDSVLAAVSALSSLRSLDLSYVQRVSFRGSPPALELRCGPTGANSREDLVKTLQCYVSFSQV